MIKIDDTNLNDTPFYSQLGGTAGGPGKEELTGMLSKENLPQYIDRVTGDLGLMSRMSVDVAKSQEIRKQLRDLLRVGIQHQTDQLVYKVTLSFDEDKKRLFSEYLNRVRTTQANLITRSNEMAAELVEKLSDAIHSALVQQSTHVKKFELLQIEGHINEDDFNIEVQRVQKWSRTLREDADAKISLILSNHATAIQRTVELFENDHFSLQ